MAKIKKGILGPITGKLGPVIGASWKGIFYLKMPSIKGSKERILSEAQKAHHQKFRFLTKWLQPLHPYVQVGYRNLAINNTEINLAFSYNFKAALKVGETGLYIDYEKVRLSRGELAGIHDISFYLLNENTLQLAWQNTSSRLSVFNDQLMLVLYNDEIGVADGFTGGIKRASNTCTYTFEQNLVGTSFHVFVALVSLNGQEISESQYLGKVDPL